MSSSNLKCIDIIQTSVMFKNIYMYHMSNTIKYKQIRIRLNLIVDNYMYVLNAVDRN